MVKYRDVVDIIEESSESEAETKEQYPEPDGPAIDNYECQESVEGNDNDHVYGGWEEEPPSYVQSNCDLPQRSRPVSPSPSVLSHHSRSSAWSYSSVGSSASTFSVMSAGRNFSGSVKNFFMRVFAPLKSSKRSDGGHQDSSCDRIEFSRPGSPTGCHSRLPSRPNSPTNVSATQRSLLRPARPEHSQFSQNSSSSRSLNGSTRALTRSVSPSTRTADDSPFNGSARTLTRSVSPTTQRVRIADDSSKHSENNQVSNPCGVSGPGRIVRGRPTSPSRSQAENSAETAPPTISNESSVTSRSRRNLMPPPSLPPAESSQPSLPTNSQLFSLGSSQRSFMSAPSERSLIPAPGAALSTGSAKDLLRSGGSSLRNLFATSNTAPPAPVKKVDRRTNRKYCNKAAHTSRNFLDVEEFTKVDADASGKISFDEFRKSLFGAALSAEDARRAFDKIDKDKSGTIDMAEWKAWTKFKAERALRKKLVTSDVLVEELLAS